MTLLPMTGRARLLGDDVSTDAIIASSRKKETIDPSVLRRYLLEDHDPAFAASVQDGDILVAGTNFGCGSAMEVAVTVVLASGIRAVVARSFSRTYLRNAMNNGLLPVVALADCAGIREGEAITLSADARSGLKLERPDGEPIACEPIAPFMFEMLASGGLVAYLRAHGGFTGQSLLRRPAASGSNQPLTSGDPTP